MEYIVIKRKSDTGSFMNLAQIEAIGLGSHNTQEVVYFSCASDDNDSQPTMFEVENIESITTNVEPLAGFLLGLHEGLKVFYKDPRDDE